MWRHCETKKLKRSGQMVCLLLFGSITVIRHTWTMFEAGTTAENSISNNRRRLLSTNFETKDDPNANSTYPFTKKLNNSKKSCENIFSKFPDDLFSRSSRLRGAILIHFLISLYMFAALAVCCDYYFVPSLQVISAKLRLQSDVAGASLLAIGGSAPELFTSIVGVFITRGDIGIGTILGSAVFNVLFVMGICGVVAGTVLRLSWWPVTRDAICYGLCIIVLTLILYDNKVDWKESVILVALYPLYILLMYFNPRLECKVYKYIGDKDSLLARFPSQVNSEQGNLLKQTGGDGEGTTYETAHDEADDCMSDKEESSELYEYELEPPQDFWKVPETCLSKLLWVVLLPANCVFFITIPDLRRERCRKLVLVTFVVSIIWIGVLTYILLWMVDTIGDTLGIPDSIMGLTFVAFGSSVPDTLSSVIVARQGLGDMAVAHSFGSNVFDILLCLGLPWSVMTIVYDPDSVVEVKSHSLFTSCFILFGLLLVCYLVIFWRKFVLDKKLGFILLALYGLFLVVSVGSETIRLLVYHEHC